MKPWLMVTCQILGCALGWVVFSITKRIVRRWRSWVVLVIYEAMFEGDNIKLTQHLFYLLRKKGEVRGNESMARRFWTKRGAKVAAAELHFSDHADLGGRTYMGMNNFRFVEIRIERIRGL